MPIPKKRLEKKLLRDTSSEEAEEELDVYDFRFLQKRRKSKKKKKKKKSFFESGQQSVVVSGTRTRVRR